MKARCTNLASSPPSQAPPLLKLRHQFLLILFEQHMFHKYPIEHGG
jgi:hypothetical protein